MDRNKLVVKKFISILTIFSVYLLWFAALFDPVGTFYGIRYLALGSCFFIIGVKFITMELSNRLYLVYGYIFIFFVLFIPGYGSLLSFIRGGLLSTFIDTSYIAAGVLFGCSLIYFDNIDLNSIIKIAMISLRILSLIIILVLVLMFSDSSSNIIHFFIKNDIAFISRRNYGGINFYYIYFIASPMIIYLLSYESWKFFNNRTFWNFVSLLIPVLALFLSGTRANMLISIIGLIFIFLWWKHNSRSIYYLLFFILLFFIIVAFINFDLIKDIFDTKDVSNSVKIGYLEVYSEIFSDPFTVLFGQGFNAHVWSKPFDSLIAGGASKTELTYLEFLRIFGIVGFVYFMYIIIFIISKVRKIPKQYGWIAPALLLYLAGSSLNPYLFSSNGMLIIGLSSVIISKKALTDGKVLNKTEKDLK